MLKVLLRLVMFFVGAALVLDIALPTRLEQLHVDQHTSHTQNDNRSGGRLTDTSYTIRFVGGSVNSCSVGYAAYSTLTDGDAVEVKVTKIFKNCVAITRGEKVISTDKYWKLFALIGGGLLIAIAFGWIKNDDGDSGFSIHLN